MHKHALTAIAALFAVFGLLSLQASELLHSVALENAANHVARLPADHTWQKELATEWLTYLAGLVHPLGLLCFLTPVAALGLWRGVAVRWVVLVSIATLFALDVYVLIESMQHPNNDRKGCEGCLVVLFAHGVAALVSFPVAVVGAGKLISERVHA
jgi:hypothetical protein